MSPAIEPSKIIGEAITFDDVLLIPRRSAILPRDAVVRTRLTRQININLPLVSAPMDTVTESRLAIALAQEGGIGIIHKNLTIEQQCREVTKVKRSESGVILDPVTMQPGQPVARARELMNLHNISGVPVVDEQHQLLGILTGRDLKFLDDDAARVEEVMTRRNLVTARPDTTLEEARTILNRAKVKKLLLVEAAGKLAGLITMRDIERSRVFTQSSKDERGRLRVGAASGVHDLERIEALIRSGVDVICVDTAHGHSENVISTVRTLKSRWKIEVIAGNIATATAARDLIDAGADALKVGIGPGSICTTRVVTGVGVPQITAIFNAVEAARIADVPVIADGGIRHSGDITKALAAGADSVMMGSMFAGLDESPGHLVIYKGRRFKEYRGMGSLGAMGAGSADRYGQGEIKKRDKFVPEGVEGRVPYRGSLQEFVYHMVGGIRAGMGYCGAATIADLQRDAQFYRVSGASVVESHPHDVFITTEAPNYLTESALEE
ncbi:MAG: Inosine-5'-monophosphate dehydrogenase [Phycisphaerae bacterium]|nr:Inosine-5'-monophosphate dehydrogenase [Phycisphaerae bacterium]